MPNRTEDAPLSRAPTLLDDPKIKVTSSPVHPRVTVLGEALHFSSRPPEASAFDARDFADRYAMTKVLGEGGMGEVRLCRDARIGRDVAMKVIRTAHGTRADYRARFLREVRVQGQLEHPSIVPVYDLGIGADGETYFTMKRVRGLTLADILDRLRERDPEARAQYSPRKLLAAFQSVCLALEFAHSRGVIHRDLKPANIMLGDFGEVYVLDWGVAKIKSDTSDPAAEDAQPAADIVDSGEHLQTQVGSFVGTLGYLSPEQISAIDVDGRSDVYSLGAILFELLTLEALHEGTPLKIAQATSEQVEARCSARAPEMDVAPELDEICVKATMLEPRDRFESARALHDAIARYLDGDRDLERRKELAEKHVEAAETEIAAIELDGGKGGAHRAKALGELGRALALDPTNESALGDMVELFLRPPPELPPEVRADLQRSRASSQRMSARAGVITFPIGVVTLVPTLMAMGVQDWGAVAVIVASLVAVSTLCLYQFFRPNERLSYLIMGCSGLAFATMSRIWGPLVLVPQMAMSTAFVYAMHPVKRAQTISMLSMVGAFVVPIALERIGVLAPSYLFTDGRMTVMPHIAALSETATLAYLGFGTVLFMLSGGASIRRVRNALNDAEERLSLQAWQLRQLVPERAREGFRLPSSSIVSVEASS